MSDVEQLKEQAGIAACRFVKDGMVLGLGTGSTVRYSIMEIARLVTEEGMDLTGVPTSEATRMLSEKLGIPLIKIEDSRTPISHDSVTRVTPEVVREVEPLGREDLIAGETTVDVQAT